MRSEARSVLISPAKKRVYREYGESGGAFIRSVVAGLQRYLVGVLVWRARIEQLRARPS